MIELRDHIEKIVPLTDDEFSLTMSYFNLRHFRKHQIVIHAGDYVRHEYFVVKGLMRSSFSDVQGKEHIIKFAPEQEWITDQQAFHESTKATLSVDCLEDTRALSISLEARLELCRNLPKFEYFFSKKTTAGYIDLQQRVLCLLTSTASKRYQNLIVKNPSLLQRVPKTLLASYLGVTRETLSRLAAAEV